ncbi:MAG: hypothetical protein MUO26_06760 [Methanotrichaceae archaeon]|nr:hypothetical protein [Methanotrichaceae archaeon]
MTLEFKVIAKTVYPDLFKDIALSDLMSKTFTRRYTLLTKRPLKVYVIYDGWIEGPKNR